MPSLRFLICNSYWASLFPIRSFISSLLVENSTRSAGTSYLADRFDSINRSDSAISGGKLALGIPDKSDIYEIWWNRFSRCPIRFTYRESKWNHFLRCPIRIENAEKRWNLPATRKLHQESTLLESKWNHVEHTDKKSK